MRALIDDLNARAGQTPSFAFVLVRSDIAFSGQRDEYRQAKVRLAAYNSSRLMPRALQPGRSSLLMRAWTASACAGDVGT